MSKKAYYITYAMLVKHSACYSQRELFLRTFIGRTVNPWCISERQRYEKVFVTPANVKKAMNVGLSIGWLLDRADWKRYPRIQKNPLADGYWRHSHDQRGNVNIIIRLLKKHDYI